MDDSEQWRASFDLPTPCDELPAPKTIQSILFIESFSAKCCLINISLPFGATTPVVVSQVPWSVGTSVPGSDPSPASHTSTWPIVFVWIYNWGCTLCQSAQKWSNSRLSKGWFEFLRAGLVYTYKQPLRNYNRDSSLILQISLMMSEIIHPN